MSDRDRMCLWCSRPRHPGSCDKVFTRAEVLAFGERVREACARTLDGPDAVSASEVRTVDVARLLEETKE